MGAAGNLALNDGGNGAEHTGLALEFSQENARHYGLSNGSVVAHPESFVAEATFHNRRVGLFTDQLVEANPILTDISDCMTGEGRARDEGDEAAAAEWGRRKGAANQKLAECAEKYNTLMAELREAGWE